MFRDGDFEEVGRPGQGHLRWREKRLDALARPKNSTAKNIGQLHVLFTSMLGFGHVFHLILVLLCSVLMKCSRTDSIWPGLFWHQILVYLYCGCTICLTTKYQNKCMQSISAQTRFQWMICVHKPRTPPLSNYALVLFCSSTVFTISAEG